MFFFRRALPALAVLALFISFSGCARLGDPLQHGMLPAGAPKVKDILKSLSENEARLAGFRATGTVVLQSPELEATQISRESSIAYRQPLDLHVVGRKYGTRFVELTCSGKAFLLQFPTEKQFYYRPEGERLNTVSSAEMAREMFQPEPWRDLPPSQVRILGYDPESQTVEMEVLDRPGDGVARRRLKVQGTPWVVLENRLLDPFGRELAVTVKGDYYERDGIRFPGKVASVFPGEQAQMSFNMRRIDINPVLDGDIFNLEANVAALNRRGFRQVETLRGQVSGGASPPEALLIEERELDSGDGGYMDHHRDDDSLNGTAE